MAPNVDSVFAVANNLNANPSTPSLKDESSQQELKYYGELERLNKQKAELDEEKKGIEDIIAWDYPDLRIARRVQKDGESRRKHEKRLRVRISLKKMNRKADNMVADAQRDREGLEQSIDRRLRCNQATITATNFGIKLCSRKRAAATSIEEGDAVKRSRRE